MADFRFELLKSRTRPGKAERGKFQRLITDNDIAFPNTVSIADIDHAFEEFVDKELSITYDGKTLQTINTMSNQRLAMYGQTWQYTDEGNNVLLNFKMVNRDIDIKKGTIVGEIYNIPGHRDHVIGYKAVRQESMLIGYDVYTVKEPTAVDLMYKVSIVTNKRELLGEFTQKVLRYFNGLEGYIYPRGHCMSMRVIDVMDESEYSLEDRKFYSQGFNILVKGFFLTEDDFKVTHRPIRKALSMTPGDDDIYGKVTLADDWVSIVATAAGDTNETSIIYNAPYVMWLRDINVSNLKWFRFFVNEEEMEFCDNQEVTIEPGDTVKITYEPESVDNEVFMKIGGIKAGVINNDNNK